MIHESAGEAHSPSQFAYSCYDHRLRRFLLCLHFPYAIEAKQNPLYSYSLKMCLECALNLVSLLDHDMYHRLLLVGDMFRDIITRGALVIYMELISQLKADDSTDTFTKEKKPGSQRTISRGCSEGGSIRTGQTVVWRTKRERLSESQRGDGQSGGSA